MTVTTIDIESPTERAASLPWEAIVRFAALATLCMSAYVLLHVAQSSANPLDFIQPGTNGPSADVIHADFPEDDLPAGLGLDGQQYYAVARDPMHVRDNAAYLDRPRYRMQRPLFPLLAWALHPTGGGTGLVVAFVVVGIAALFVGSLATGALSITLGGPAWAAMFFAAAPGAFWSLRVTVADSLALALALCAVAFAARSHHRRALICALLAVLTKEVALLILIGWYLSNRSRRNAFMAGAATATIIGWAAVLRVLLPPDPAGVNEFGFPFVGLVRAASRHWFDHQELWGGATAVTALVLAAFVLARHQLRHPLSGIVAALVAFAAIMNSDVIGLNFGATRSMMGLLVVAALAVVTPRATRTINQ
ncbi:MAG: hypothetical protein ABI658_24540 [Acidimicrobiales bacterium]